MRKSIRHDDLYLHDARLCEYGASHTINVGVLLHQRAHMKTIQRDSIITYSSLIHTEISDELVLNLFQKGWIGTEILSEDPDYSGASLSLEMSFGIERER